MDEGEVIHDKKKRGKDSPPCPGKKEPPLILSPLKIEVFSQDHQ